MVSEGSFLRDLRMIGLLSLAETFTLSKGSIIVAAVVVVLIMVAVVREASSIIAGIPEVIITYQPASQYTCFSQI